MRGVPVQRPVFRSIARPVYRPTYGALAGFAQVYIDPTQSGTGHTGKYTDPYSTADAITYFATLSGAINRRIRFKAGTFFRGLVSIAGSAYVLEPYGDGSKPLISNHVDVSAETWTQVGATDEWTMANAQWGGGNTAVILDRKQCEGRSSLADLQNTDMAYQCNETAFSTWPYRYWYDAGASVMHIWVDTAEDPNDMEVWRPVASQYSMLFNSGENVTVDDIDISSGGIGNFQSNSVNGLTLNRVDSYNAGGHSGAQNCFNITGASAAAFATDIALRSCRARRSHAAASSHGFEFSWLDGVSMTDAEATDIRLHAIELWESCKNLTVARMKVRQTSSFMIITAGSAGVSVTNHENVFVTNSECVQRASYTYKGAGSNQAGGYGIFSGVDGKITTGLKIYNNSFEVDSAAALGFYASAATGVGSNDVRVKNNILRAAQITNSAQTLIRCHAADARAAEWVMDHNVYQFAVSQTNMYKVGTASNASSFAAYQALWDAVVATNEDNSVNPAAGADLFVTPSGTIQSAELALLPTATSAIGRADSADADTPTTDFLGVARGDDPDAGAYEQQG